MFWQSIIDIFYRVLIYAVSTVVISNSRQPVTSLSVCKCYMHFDDLHNVCCVTVQHRLATSYKVLLTNILKSLFNVLMTCASSPTVTLIVS